MQLLVKCSFRAEVVKHDHGVMMANRGAVRQRESDSMA
jgi:hypothetical protein